MSSLSPQQQAAAHSGAAQVVTAAAAGSGKTRVLVERVLWLMDELKANPREICVVTFTNAAARELRARLSGRRIWQEISMVVPTPVGNGQFVQFLPPNQPSPIEVRALDGIPLGHCGTLHSLALRQAQSPGRPVSVLDDEGADEMLAEICAEVKLKCSRKELDTAVVNVLNGLIGGKNMRLDKVHIVANEFVRRMRQGGELTYDALLAGLARQAASLPFQHLLVDECQDSAPLDWEVYARMRAGTKFFVGDDMQSIFGFRGSDVRLFEAMARNTELHKLSINYRSCPEVVSASQRLAERLPGRIPNPTEAAPGAGAGGVHLSEFSDSKGEMAGLYRQLHQLQESPSSETAAVLLRTNALADHFRTVLAQMALPVAIQRRTEAKDPLVDSVLAAMAAPWSDRAVSRMLDQLEPGSGAAMRKAARLGCASVAGMASLRDVSACKVADHTTASALVHDFLHRIPSAAGKARLVAGEVSRLVEESGFRGTPQELLLLARRSDAEPERQAPGIHVGTVHSAKGLEWDRVFLPAFEDETWPGKKTGPELDEEARLAYVAVTRARKSVHMSWARTRPDPFANWRQLERTPSRFAVEAAG